MSGEWEEITQIRAITSIRSPEAEFDAVLLVDCDPQARRWMREMVAGVFGLDEVDSGQAALERISTSAPRIVVIGCQLTDMTIGEWLALATPVLGNAAAPIPTFLLADAAGIAAEVDEATLPIFYRLLRTMQAKRVVEVLRQAASKLPARLPEDAGETPPDVAEHAKLIGAATELEAAARAAINAVHALIGTDRARCLYCDSETGTIWAGAEEGEHQAQASAGLAGFAIRTISSISVPRAGEDPLYLAAIDDPIGDGTERIVVQPVVGLDGKVHAVLMMIRAGYRPNFIESDVTTLAALALAWTPYLEYLAMRVEADEILGDRLDGGPSDMFRQEAIMHMMRRGNRGDVVRVHPAWIRAAYWLVLGSLLAAGTFVALAHIDQYTSGPAVVRYTGRSDVVAFEGGTISALEVTRGQRVSDGQVLARLYDAEQAGKLRGLDTEFERKLVSYLQTPADPSVRQALAQVVSQRESARASVESRVIRAPRAGIIKEVVVRNGQQVEAGKVVLSIANGNEPEGLTVLAFLPGSDRPRLRAHQELHLILPGYRGADLGGEVRAVSVDVLGASDARTRYLGERLGDSLPITGTVVVVEARLETTEFDTDGHHYVLHDGMIGDAEVKLDSRSVLETMLPGMQ